MNGMMMCLHQGPLTITSVFVPAERYGPGDTYMEYKINGINVKNNIWLPKPKP